MFKKITNISLGFILFFTFTTAGLAHDYEDVSRESEYFYSIDYLKRNDVFRDTSYFYPEKFITKADFVKYLVLLNSPEFKPNRSASLPFEDVRNNAWYVPYFYEAINLGILDERIPRIEPDKLLTMVDALTLLFHSQSIPIPKVYKGNIPYADVSRNKKASALIMQSIFYGLIEPKSSDSVGIYRRVTRAEAAMMIYKLDLVSLRGANNVPVGNSGGKAYGPELSKIIAAWEKIESTYLFKKKLDRPGLADAALGALVDELGDPYSRYLNVDANQSFEDSLSGDLEGIGAVVGYNEEGEISIVSPLANSPAEKAGIKAKDIILEVDGQSIADYTIEEAIVLIKGPKGTSVELKIRRAGKNKLIKIVRDVISIETLSYKTLNGGIYSLKLSQFGVATDFEFAEVAKLIEEDAKAKGILIDLRGNPGGILGVTVNILGHFVEAQEEVVSINYTDYKQVLLSRGRAELANLPVVVLIDEGSASASEILAGVLQDYGIATLVGNVSFGKGTVQQVSEFLDNSSIKLTIARWLTPKKQDIADNGITPDILIEDDQATETDEQFDRALEELNRLIR